MIKKKKTRFLGSCREERNDIFTYIPDFEIVFSSKYSLNYQRNLAEHQSLLIDHAQAIVNTNRINALDCIRSIKRTCSLTLKITLTEKAGFVYVNL